MEKGEFNIALVLELHKLEYCLNNPRAQARVPLGFQQHLKHTNFQTLNFTLSLPITWTYKPHSQRFWTKNKEKKKNSHSHSHLHHRQRTFVGGDLWVSSLSLFLHSIAVWGYRGFHFQALHSAPRYSLSLSLSLNAVVWSSLLLLCFW